MLRGQMSSKTSFAARPRETAMDYQASADRGPARDDSQERGTRTDAPQGLLDFGKERISQQFNEASDVVRRATEGLDQNTGLCRIAERAADTLAGAGKYIASADPRSIVRDTNNFAHKQPELFLGSAFLGGLMLGRFLRSRPPEAARSGDGPSSNQMGYLGQMQYASSGEEDDAASAEAGSLEDTRFDEGEVSRGG
jgi:hypothetical protein